jgi:hypothetical protein
VNIHRKTTPSIIGSDGDMVPIKKIIWITIERDLEKGPSYRMVHAVEKEYPLQSSVFGIEEGK